MFNRTLVSWAIGVQTNLPLAAYLGEFRPKMANREVAKTINDAGHESPVTLDAVPKSSFRTTAMDVARPKTIGTALQYPRTRETPQRPACSLVS